MLTRHHSLLGVACAVVLPISWLLPVGIVSHLLLDKFSGYIESDKQLIQIEALTHLILLLIAVLTQSIAIFVYAIICFNLPDILKKLSTRIDPHRAVTWTSNRLTFTKHGQEEISVILWSIFVTCLIVVKELI